MLKKVDPAGSTFFYGRGVHLGFGKCLAACICFALCKIKKQEGRQQTQGEDNGIKGAGSESEHRPDCGPATHSEREANAPEGRRLRSG